MGVRGGSRRRGFAWALFAAAVVFYAVLSFQSGVHNLPMNFEERHLQLLDEVEAKANLGVPYAAFLSAPLQRHDWMVFGQVYPHLSQGEVNNLVNIITFWQCLLVAYLLFACNRASAPVRSQPVPAPVASPVAAGIFWTLAFAAVLTTFAFYVHSPGLAQWQVVRDIVPASTLAADAALFDGRTLQNLVFATATGIAVLSGIRLLMRDGASRAMRRAFYASAAVSGAIQVAWGWQLGEPSMQVIAGGRFCYTSGVSVAGFAAIALWLERRGREHLSRETMVLAVNFAFVPALLLWQHALWWALGIAPQAYLDVGHDYVLAAGGAIPTATLNGFIGAIASGETRSRAIG